MISLEVRPIVHEFIVLDLAIRSLQQDYTKFVDLKMHAFYSRWIKVDVHFSDVTIATAGEDIVLRYANQALKTQVEEMLIEKATSA